MLIILMLSLLNFIIARKKSFKTVSTQVNLERNEMLQEKLDHLEEENRSLEKMLLEQQNVIKLALRRIVVPTGQPSHQDAFCNVGSQTGE